MQLLTIQCITDKQAASLTLSYFTTFSTADDYDDDDDDEACFEDTHVDC